MFKLSFLIIFILKVIFKYVKLYLKKDNLTVRKKLSLLEYLRYSSNILRFFYVYESQ